MTSKTIYESAAETAKKIRQALKKAFPELPARHFSVKSDTYSGGSSIHIHFEDYPSYSEVDKIARKFAGATFDGMTDMKEYTGYIWEEDGQRYSGADFVSVSKDFSDAYREQIEATYKESYGDGNMTNHRFHEIDEELCKARKSQAPVKNKKVINKPLDVVKLRQLVEEKLLSLVSDEFKNITTSNYLMDKVDFNKIYKLNETSEHLTRDIEQYASAIVRKYENSYKAYSGLMSAMTIAVSSYGFEYNGGEMPEELLYELAENNKVRPLQDDLSNWVQIMYPTFAKTFNQVFEPKVFTARDKQLVLSICSELANTLEKSVVDKLKKAITETQYIMAKHLDKEIQRKNYELLLQQALENLAEPIEETIARLTGQIQAHGLPTEYTKDTYVQLRVAIEAVQNAIKNHAPSSNIWTAEKPYDTTLFWLVNGELLVIHPHLLANYHTGHLYFDAGKLKLSLLKTEETEVDKKFTEVFNHSLIPYLKTRLRDEQQQKSKTNAILYTDEDMRRMNRLETLVKEHTQNLSTVFKVMNGRKVMLVVGRQGKTAIVSPYSVQIIQQNQGKEVIKRNPSESFQLFETIARVFIGVVGDLEKAKALADCVHKAFDLRHAVDLKGKRL